MAFEYEANKTLSETKCQIYFKRERERLQPRLEAFPFSAGDLRLKPFLVKPRRNMLREHFILN
jgi:hypothetical protein